MVRFDSRWAAEVVSNCDPVFAAAGVGFVRSPLSESAPDEPAGSLLWEADPAQFAAKYPESGIVESYGAEQWEGVGCIDFWLHVDAQEEVCRLSVEGWNLPEILVKTTGHGALDGSQVAAAFARILGVRWRR
ncbi:hypothetical protein [Nocardioides houyundeii]|uniref:hypothetical protein n=1 Tax=Nocardioides houyundeii TaxID=2045452 RepID=UPI000C792F80|nr:hypothetical protein [Nocardioides houyundeii]